MAGTNYKCSSHQSSPLYEVAAVSIAIVLSLAVIGLLAVALHCCLRSLKEAQEDDAADRHRASTNGDDRVVPQHQQPATVVVEMVRSTEPLLCTYRRADGWPEATCAVCLADFDDGEPVRVLPECMHYFHADCIGTWLRGSTSCPMCRAETTPTPSPASMHHHHHHRLELSVSLEEILVRT